VKIKERESRGRKHRASNTRHSGKVSIHVLVARLFSAAMNGEAVNLVIVSCRGI